MLTRLFSCRCMLILAMLTLTMLAPLTANAAEANYPSKPIRVIVPYPPGGSTDPTARAYANWLTEKFGVALIIDNRPGAGSTIGHGLGARATPDGYTILLGTSGGLVVSAAFGSPLSYNPIKDFTPIAIGVYAPFLLVVHPGVPAKNMRELIDLAKAQPYKINYGSPGTGTPNHLGMELLTALTGAKFTHVPYKGGGAATVDLVAGRIQAIFGSIPQWQPHLGVGKVRALAIGHPKRSHLMPDTPAIAETFPGFNNTTWYGFLGPAGMPNHAVQKINAEMKRATENANFVKGLEAIGLEPAWTSSKDMGDLIRNELARWTKVVRDAGIKPE
jgi:tripartite-type tricarboxylate transporter receptor subunit TctC